MGTGTKKTSAQKELDRDERIKQLRNLPESKLSKIARYWLGKENDDTQYVITDMKAVLR